MDKFFSISDKTLYTFMEATEGNYRNAIYVECSNACPYQDNCKDFLFIPGYDAKPILLPICDAECFFGFTVDKSDCCTIISSKAFMSLYARWIEQSLSNDGPCPIQKILDLCNK